MKNILILPAILLLSLTTGVFSIGSNEVYEEEPINISITCNFKNIPYIFFNGLHSCVLTSTEKITSSKATIISTSGGCTPSSPNNDVKVFYALSKVVKYIPSGLNLLFPKMIGFRLENTQLNIVTKKNLQPFTELKMFAVPSNNIQYLEKDLFMHNTKLIYVSFRANKITYIHQDLFAGLNNLEQLWMDAQAADCRIGTALSNSAVKTALNRFSTSVCVDIQNAPALYLMYLELQTGSNEKLQECQDDLAALQQTQTETASNFLATISECRTCLGSTPCPNCT